MILSFTLSILALAATVLSQSSSTHSVYGSSASLPGQPLSSSGTPSVSSSGSQSLTNSAQLPSLTGYSTCLDSCFDNAVAATGCDSVAAVDCFCSSANVTAFENALVNCMSTQCPSSLSTAEGVAQQFCNVASSSASLSFPAPSLTPTQSSTPASSSSPSATSPPTSSSGASSHSASATSSTTMSISTNGAEQFRFGTSLGCGILMTVGAGVFQWL